MYKKILITILSILCLCSNGVYAEDIIEQQTEPVIDNIETVEEIPSDNITETKNTDVVEDTTTDTNNDREDVIKDGSNVDNVITDATQDKIEEISLQQKQEIKIASHNVCYAIFICLFSLIIMNINYKINHHYLFYYLDYTIYIYIM